MLNLFGDGTNDLNELDGYPFIDSYEIGFNDINSDDCNHDGTIVKYK